MELGTLVIVNFVTACLCAISLSVKRHPIFATIAWLLTCVYGCGVYRGGIDVEDTLVQMMRNAEGYDEERSAPAVWGGYLALTLTSVAAGLYPWLKRWAVILWGVFLFLASALVSLYSPLSILEGLYAICCAMMCELAHMFGMKYLEMCVFGAAVLSSAHIGSLCLAGFLGQCKRLFLRWT